MSELSFVLKSFALSLVLVICMQAKVGGMTLEDHAYTWVETSAIPRYLQEVAQGGVVVIRKAAGTTTDFIAGVFGRSKPDVTQQKAGRLNFEIKRSDNYIKSIPEKAED